MIKKRFLTLILVISSVLIVGCTSSKETTIEDVTIEKTEVSESSDSNEIDDKYLGYELDSSSNPSLQEKENDEEMIQEMLDGENSGIQLYEGEREFAVRITDLSTLHPSDGKLKPKLNSNLTDYFKHYCPNLDKDYAAIVVEGSEEETNTYYTVKLRIEGFNADGTDFIVKAIWPFGTPTDQFNFYSDLSPDGTYVLVDKDGNPIDWDSPINNPFAEEE